MNQRTGSSQREALLKSYTRRLKDDINSILDNYTEIIKAAKVEEETQVARLTQSVEDGYEIDVRASNVVRAGESLMKLISDIKEFLILNDFPAVNMSLQKRSQHLKTIEDETKKKLWQLREQIGNDLKELEQEYYLSKHK
ncbi:mediator of RNA polymerase II transcription subunit 22-like [Hydractinia symbiolongicarpus]|uniref:mediator of RNA polymerase II transcription subunit 22-like n=1 Tax=Hydractinia symbiolongicarpus TaxID=13093 RepID=UPI00254F508D|nr:mediator of RNA polymerase II transcription subunit 22-like [Hydractinia symbiolongicarpus]